MNKKLEEATEVYEAWRREHKAVDAASRKRQKGEPTWMQEWVRLEMRMGKPDWIYGDSPSEEEAGEMEEEEAQFTDEDEEDCDDKEGEWQKVRPCQ